MWFAVVAVALAAAPSPTIKAALVGFKSVDTDEKKAAVLGEYFAEQLSSAGHFPVSTPSEISAIIGLERQKQLLGCAEDGTSCQAELMGALGVDAVITGSVARLSGQYLVTVKISAAKDGAQLASASTQLAKETEIAPWLSDQAKSMGPLVRRKLTGGSAAPAEVTASSSGGSSKAWVPLAGGAVLLAGGVVSYGIAANMAAKIDGENSPYQSRKDAEDAAKTAGTLQTVAFVAGGVGVAAIIAGGILMATDDSSSESVSAAPFFGAGSVGLAVEGRF